MQFVMMLRGSINIDVEAKPENEINECNKSKKILSANTSSYYSISPHVPRSSIFSLKIKGVLLFPQNFRGYINLIELYFLYFINH